MSLVVVLFIFFFFTAPATTEIYTLSLHDALPILWARPREGRRLLAALSQRRILCHGSRSEEHTSELQSHHDLVCRLLLEKKKKTEKKYISRAWYADEQTTSPVRSYDFPRKATT